MAILCSSEKRLWHKKCSQRILACYFTIGSLYIFKKLFSSFAINVKLLDLFSIANAIFRFLKNFCLRVDCLITYTANVSKVLKNIDEKLLSSLVLITSSLLVTKNLSATSNIFSVIESTYCGKKAISKSHLGANVRNPDIKQIKNLTKYLEMILIY